MDPHAQERTGLSSRRRFLGALAVGLGALWSVSIAALVSAFASAPLRRHAKEDEILLGDLTIYGPEFREVSLRIATQDGWHRRFERKTFYIHADAEGLPEVFSSRCTHLGCTVRWNGEADEFQCPCHGGRFDAEGRVLGGPPSEPLRKIPAQLRGGDIYIRETT